jgi:uncharacterized protein YbcI
MSAADASKDPLPADGGPPPGERAAAISALVVKLMSEYTGRGPTKARTYIDRDVITVLLRDTLTKGERSLVRDGKAELVTNTRSAFQQTMKNDLVAGVEALTGRSVLAFMSTNHLDPDMAAEIFVLAPLGTLRQPEGVASA